jgi:hypothetical protein
MQERGIPARELSDHELERQGASAHLTRNRVFLHGTAEQFRYHTERMLELEQEYLRRHPKRTWQGRADGAVTLDLAEENRLAQIRQLVKSFVDQMNVLLSDDSAPDAAAEPDDRALRLLTLFAGTPTGGMHKLEAHQYARDLGLSPSEVAQLYKHQPPLLAAAGQDRVITEAGRTLAEAAE